MSPSCSYVNYGIRDKNSQVRKAGPGLNDVHARIRHLEEMVTALVSQQPSHQGTFQSDSFPEFTGNKLDDHDGRPGLQGSEESFGRISIEGNQPNYVGGAHWAAVLDNVRTRVNLNYVSRSSSTSIR